MPRSPRNRIWQRSDGRFTVVAERRPERGDFRARAWFKGYRPTHESTQTEEGALHAARAIWEAYCRGDFGGRADAPPATVGELLDRVEEREDLSRATRGSYGRVVKLLVDHLGDERTLRTVNPNDVKRWLDSLTCSEISRATYLRTIKAVFRWAGKQGWMERDPCKGNTIKVRHVMRPWLEHSEWEPFLEACSAGHRVRAVFVLETGLRAGELVHARWEWVQGSLGRRSIRVDHDPETGFRPKWGQARAVPLSKRAEETLESARELWPEGSFIFADRLLSHPNFARANRGACAKAGVTRVDFHGLRRSAGARWLELGFDLLEVSRLLGHQSVTTTERWYAGISPGRLARRFDIVDAADEAMRSGEVLPFRGARKDTEG